MGTLIQGHTVLDIFFALPLETWIVYMLLGIGTAVAFANRRNGIGIPIGMVLATVTVWYVFDVYYNNYPQTYAHMFHEVVLIDAWWQVIVFLFTFISLAPILHSLINRRYLSLGSQIWIRFKGGVDDPEYQQYIGIIMRYTMSLWAIIMMTAVFRYQGDILYFFFPYLGKHPGPWLTSSLGGGFDSLLALVTNMHMMVGAVFGVIAAISTNTKVRRLALLGIFLSWPLYLFDRTRGYILVIAIPAAVAWVFLRIRGGILKKLFVLTVLYLLLNSWFGFIISTRSQEGIAQAFIKEGVSYEQASKEHHQGLNMFEELSWILMLKDNGIFKPPMGENYFANLVNPIPRSLWYSKPTVGLDYAIVRGLGGADSGAGVFATLSQGVIGQGVVNFGAYVGAAFAAILMSLWACILARIDLKGDKIGYLPLFGIGIILTFNMGRDITMMNLYPFAFSYAFFWWINRRNSNTIIKP